MVEVGAGVGAHALRLSRIVGNGGHLFLYEKEPLLKRILGQNLTMNRISNVTLMRRNLAHPARIATPTTDLPGVSRLSHETIDELQLEALDWLKINLEVDCADVIDGAVDSIWRLRPKIFIALPEVAELENIGTRLRELGYRFWRMETALFNPDNFNHRTDDLFAGHKVTSLLAIPEEIDIAVELPGCVELT